jgi:hypothetical protein
MRGARKRGQNLLRHFLAEARLPDLFPKSLGPFNLGDSRGKSVLNRQRQIPNQTSPNGGWAARRMANPPLSRHRGPGFHAVGCRTRRGRTRRHRTLHPPALPPHPQVRQCLTPREAKGCPITFASIPKVVAPVPRPRSKSPRRSAGIPSRRSRATRQRPCHRTPPRRSLLRLNQTKSNLRIRFDRHPCGRSQAEVRQNEEPQPKPIPELAPDTIPPKPAIFSAIITTPAVTMPPGPRPLPSFPPGLSDACVLWQSEAAQAASTPLVSGPVIRNQ